MPDRDAALEAHLGETRDSRYTTLFEFLRIPSISALPDHAADCRRAAGWVADALTAAGVEHAEVCETDGHPVVYADWLHAPGAPTVLVYGHYDVQPVDPLELWTSPPFVPVIEGRRLLARGAADDKGQIHAHVMAAAALLATRGAMPVNVRYLFEGEEESGSVNLDRWLQANQARLAADAVVVSDTGFFEGNVPAITTGLRGLMYAQIDVVGHKVDLHSGGFGGTVENPANALAQIIAALKGPDGRIRIPGFYDDVMPLTDADRADFAALPFDEAAYLERLGLPALAGEVGYTTLERRGGRPTLDVNGLWGGFSGAGSKTIIPAHAHAKVSCRLVASQEPGRVFEQLKAYVEQIAPPGVTTTVTFLGGGRPSLTPKDHPATCAAARAIEATFGRSPVYIREGGSIPVTASFERILGLPVVLLGIVQPDCNAHAPNEWLDLDNYETGIRTFARLFDELTDVRT
ncbi:MAG TPA: dipeptidase [Candidatus Limnocylindrales bacterium]|jgi:acetylornithine deacetylase/succinyl-diaminopimelate desuccinylase-like protein